MKRTDLPQRFQDLLHDIPYATIATVRPDGQPWNTPMVAHFDDELHMYWLTNVRSQHAQNIARNPRIFVVIYDSRVPLGEGDALYLQMRARALTSQAAIDRARQVSTLTFAERLPDHAEFRRDCPRRLFEAAPERIWHSIEAERLGHIIDSREQLLPRAR